MLHYDLVTEYKKSEWITIIIFDVIFPTWDVFSDLSLIINWLWNSHTTYAIFVSIPLLCKFLFICYKWYMIEKRKKWTWILLLAQIWPQWRSARVARLLYKGDTRAQLKNYTRHKYFLGLEFGEWLSLPMELLHPKEAKGVCTVLLSNPKHW